MKESNSKRETIILPSENTLKIHYVLSNYISHRRAGENNMRSLAQCNCELISEMEQADIVVLHMEPWNYTRIFEHNPCLKSKYVIGYVVWETDILCDQFREQIQLLDEVWTCSSYCREAIEKDFSPVTVIPHVVPAATARPEIVTQMRQELGLPKTGLTFYTVADHRSPRKNLKAAIDAFSRIPSDCNARFLIKTPEPLTRGMINRKRISNLHGMWPDEYLDGLHALGDCFVSSHHSEGWGLGMSEAMAAGNLVIATGHGGNMEFMSVKNSLPVAYRLDRVPRAYMNWIRGLWSSSMSWAYIDEDELVSKMLMSIQDWPATRKLRKRAQRDMRKYDFQSIATILDRRLQLISEKLN